MDYRATGLTRTPAGGDLSTTLLGNNVIAVLDALDVAQAHVYGTSMGGRVAQIVAAHHPGRVRSLILACTSPGGKRATERSNDVRRALANPDDAARRATLVRLFYTPSWGDDAARSRLLGGPTMLPADRQRHLKMSARHYAWNLLPQIRCPTIVLHGSDDEMTPSVNAAVIAERVPNARLYIHPGGRHGFFEEFVDHVDPVLDAFWSNVDWP